MNNFKILNQQQLQEILDMNSVIKSNEEVYKAKSDNETVVWPTTYYEFEPGKADMDIKSGYLPTVGIFGHKTVSFFGDNPQKNLPDLVGMVVVFSSKTGMPIGILNGSYITGIRTGAAGAIGAKLLARPNSKNLLILGAGNQAAFQIAGMLKLFPNLEKIAVADAMNHEHAQQFVDGIQAKLKNNFSIDAQQVTFSAVADLPEAVHNSDIIITVTPSKKPIIKKEWVAPGTHFSCIGADAEGKEEIDPQIFAGAQVFVDDRHHCILTGEIEIPIKKGIIQKDEIKGEIGDLLNKKVSGRQNDQEITIFDAVGMALLDLAAADKALKIAQERGIGIEASI